MRILSLDVWAVILRLQWLYNLRKPVLYNEKSVQFIAIEILQAYL